VAVQGLGLRDLAREQPARPGTLAVRAPGPLRLWRDLARLRARTHGCQLAQRAPPVRQCGEPRAEAGGDSLRSRQGAL